jgi:hypothetical protein
MPHPVPPQSVLRGVARGFTHLVRWVDYYSGADTKPSGSPARMTIYSSRPAGDYAAVEGVDLLETAA